MSLRSWRDYADVVALVSVRSESRGEPTSSGARPGESTIPRVVDIDVNERLWARHEIPVDHLSIQNHGWVVSPENGERALQIEGATRLEVGERYVIALARNLEGSWMLLSADAALPVQGGQVADVTVEASGVGEDVPALTPAEIGERLRALPPDPQVEQYAAYSPHIRYELVLADHAGDEDGIFADAGQHPTTTLPGGR